MAQESGDITGLVLGVRRRWRVLALVAVPLWIGVLGYAQSLPSAYDSTAIVALTPRADADVGGDTIRILVPKYVAYVTSRPTATEVARSVSVSEADLREGTDAAVAPDTSNVTITVRMRSPEQASRAANGLAAATARLSDSDVLLSAAIIVPAVPVSTPASPPRRLLGLGGLVLAVLAGLTAATVVDRSKPRVGSAAELTQLLGHRTLVSVPRSRAMGRAPVEALADESVNSAIGGLRVQVDAESRLDPVTLLAVTSPTSGDGKTSVAAALATALSRLDTRVLLIDADLRRPRVAEHLRLTEWSDGFAEVLEGSVPLSQAVYPVPHSALKVIPTDERSDAGDLLARRLGAVLAQARGAYDLVVVDCPPVLATDDALVIATTCDATILVVQHGSTLSQVAAAGASLDALKVRLLGTVLNRAPASRRDAYGSYSSYTSLVPAKDSDVVLPRTPFRSS